MKRILLASSVAASFTGFASAGVTILTDLSDLFTTEALTGFTTSGDQMDGMLVSVTYSDLSTASATWGTTGAGAGEAAAAGFNLSMSGNTFGSPWTLTNLDTTNSITGFSINARPGDTVFDRFDFPDTRTAGSADGWDFASTDAGDVTVTYSDPLKLNSAALPLEDLFLSLDVTLDNFSLAPAGPTAPGGSYVFIQDTDNVRDTGDITTVPQIPEPSTGLSIGLLLSAAFFLRRRK